MTDTLTVIDKGQMIIVEISNVSVVPGPPGPLGPAGPPGPPGPQGIPGTSVVTRYIHTQAVLSPTWVVVHNLNGHPTVMVEDAVGNVLHGSITYIDDNTLMIGFAYSITGRANCL